MKAEKIKWLSLLLVAIVSFILSLITKQLFFNVIAILLAIYIYKDGDAVLFKEYNERSKSKREQGKIMREASRKIILEGKFKNKGGE